MNLLGLYPVLDIYHVRREDWFHSFDQLSEGQDSGIRLEANLLRPKTEAFCVDHLRKLLSRLELPSYHRLNHEVYQRFG